MYIGLDWILVAKVKFMQYVVARAKVKSRCTVVASVWIGKINGSPLLYFSIIFLMYL